MATEQKKREISDLVNHMKKYKDAVLILGEKIAPELNVKSISDEEGEGLFNRKSWVKTPEAFWNYYFENIYIDKNKIKEMPKVYQSVKELLSLGLIKKVYSVNTHGVLEEALNLKGTGLGVKCSKCGETHDLTLLKESSKEFSKESLIEKMNKIECNKCKAKKLRPTCLMYGENYFFDEMKNMLSEVFNNTEGEMAVPNTHTIMYLGVDMEEDFIAELFDNYLLVRDRIEEECFNVMITDITNTIELFKPEFARDGDMEDSLNKLISILK